MTDYSELVKDLRDTEMVCRDRMDGQVMLDAAAAIEELDAEETRLLLITSELQDKVMDLQAQLPKRGKWELIDGAEPMRWGCSRCKYLSWETSNYCPRCGAKMEVQE